MKALLLSAGIGSRLRPLTDLLPKGLFPIRGYPLLNWWIDSLHKAGINEILINTHYKADIFKNYLQELNLKNISLTYEKNLLGTGGTVLKNLDFFKNEPFLVAHADNLSRFSVKHFLEKHRSRRSGSEITMMTFKTPTPKSCGIVKIEKDIVTEFHEKVQNPPSNIANGAVYIFENTIGHFLKSKNQENIDISLEVIPYFLGKITSFQNDTYHRDIGTLDSYAEALEEWSWTDCQIDKEKKWKKIFQAERFTENLKAVYGEKSHTLIERALE